jgi:hypothetical protein
VKQFNYLGRELSLESEQDFDKKIDRFQNICGTIRKHLKKLRIDTRINLYEVVVRPTLLYGSETWVTTKRDMTRLEAAEMYFLRSVKGYTRLDQIRTEIKRKELEVSGKQKVSAKHKIGSTILKEWITVDSRNTSLTTNLEGKEIVGALGNDGNASMPEHVKRPNPWSKMIIMMVVIIDVNVIYVV